MAFYSTEICPLPKHCPPKSIFSKSPGISEAILGRNPILLQQMGSNPKTTKILLQVEDSIWICSLSHVSFLCFKPNSFGKWEKFLKSQKNPAICESAAQRQKVLLIMNAPKLFFDFAQKGLCVYFLCSRAMLFALGEQWILSCKGFRKLVNIIRC